MITKELEKAGVPVSMVSAMYPLAEQVGASRIIRGVRIPHPCGDPNLPPEADARLRQTIVKTALDALKTDVTGPTLFESGTAKNP